MFIKEDLRSYPIVGITGSMGAGKSQLTSWLQSEGLAIVDFDKLSRLVRKHPEVIKTLMNEFGTVDPLQLREIVKDSLKMVVLHEIVTRRVLNLAIQETKKFMKEGHRVVFWDAAIMIEIDVYQKLAGVILVTAEEAVRLPRILQRDGLTMEQIRPLLKYQLSESDKLAKIKEHPHFLVLDNNNSPEQFSAQFGEIVPFLRTLPFWNDYSV